MTQTKKGAIENAVEGIGKNSKESATLNSINPTRQVQNYIYVYSHGKNVKSHIGWLKIGQTRVDVKGRIFTQNEADNIPAEIVWKTPAVRKLTDKKAHEHLQPFSDRDIHTILSEKGYERERKHNTNSGRDSEWFKIKLPEVKKIVEAYKNGDYSELTSRDADDFILRKEQADAVELTTKYWRSAIKSGSKVKPNFLWNAKPRFGKTLTAYEFARSIGAKRVLIITNRPATSDSWFSDFHKFVKPHRREFLFMSAKTAELKNSDTNQVIAKSLTREEQIELGLEKSPYFYFISLQDIKGKSDSENGAKEYKNKNKWLFGANLKKPWDLVIIDESHEGVRTKKAKQVLKNINATFTLSLSGTPFKDLKSGDFSANQVYSWSYTDEQESKLNWKLEDGTNPYLELPKMNIFAYQLCNTLQVQAQEAQDEGMEYAFDLGEFFKITADHFVYEEDVRKWLENLTSGDFPFNPEYRDKLRHTFWLLPGVKACKAMEKLLKENDVFKNYKIVLAAGTGESLEGIQEEEESEKTKRNDKALAKVRQAIGSNPLETKTITLSCGQLTTGVTVPEWSAVLMLNNVKSPSLYLQAAFRAQNPWTYDDGVKTNCYVFDFAPDRVLTVLADYADDLIADSVGFRGREPKVRKLLNFLSVLAADNEGKMKELNAQEVLDLPLKLATEEVVNRGFMSNRLFDNIANIFGVPILRDIVNKMTPEKNKRVSVAKEMDNSGITLDKEGKPEVTKAEIEKVINSSNGLLGDKQYVVEGTPEAREVEKRLAVGEDPDKLPEILTQTEIEERAKEEAVNAKTKVQKSEEEQVRDRLRGFSRTIPTFLMAYGNYKTTLKDFEKDIPEDTFLELTSITVDEFKMLRDGGVYTDENGDVKRFETLFNERVFNQSIREFLERKRRLANYYETQDDDIFNYIPPQKTNQIFTPKRVVKMMVDALEGYNPDIFKNSNTKFIDLYMKSGLYITEIVRRLFIGLRDWEPDEKKRILHILANQVYGFAPTNVLYNICTELIFGFLRDKTGDSKDDTFTKDELQGLQDHFKELDITPLIKNGDKDALKEKLFKIWGMYDPSIPKEEQVKFDVIISNPPYQKQIIGTSDAPIYPLFIDAAQELSDIVAMVHPARFLFNAGKTSKEWNEKMLNDPHLEVVYYEQKSEKVFPNTDIKGGVCITLWDKNSKEGGLRGIFLHIPELATILRKVKYGGFDKIIFSQTKLRVAIDLKYPSERRIISNWFEKFPDSFVSAPDKIHSIKIVGLEEGNKRSERYVLKDLLDDPNLKKYKVFLPGSNGSGAIGEVLSTPLVGEPLVGEPLVGCTQTFIQIGSFDSELEAQNCMKYIKSKFCRTMLGTLKITQSNKKETWKNVPLQDFTPSSDIDWSRSIPEIDRQLYKKYGLTKKEIDFIEEKIEQME